MGAARQLRLGRGGWLWLCCHLFCEWCRNVYRLTVLLILYRVLGTKANLISALTGVPHEKLQVFHHWTSYAMFVLALIHTFPFIVLHIQEGDMVSEWNTSLVYWTGVAALIPQAYLTFMSLPAIRFEVLFQ